MAWNNEFSLLYNLNEPPIYSDSQVHSIKNKLLKWKFYELIRESNKGNVIYLYK